MGEVRNLVEEQDDEELIYLIKQGETYLFEVLFRRYSPLVLKMEKDYYLKSYETDDFWQEGRVVFHKTILTYDKEKGHTFGNFFKMNLKHHIFSLIRKDMAKKRLGEKSAESLEGLMEKGPYSQYILNRKESLSALEVLQMKEKLSGYFSYLSKFETQVFTRYLSNEDAEEIAVSLECDTMRVKNALDRCKRKMRQALE